MEVLRLDQMDERKVGIAIALGNFDGVHLGHQKLLKATVKFAKDNGLESAALLFDPHPSQFFQRENFKLINTLEQRLDSLSSIGIELAIIIDFTEDFTNLSAEEFIDLVLVNKLRVKYVASGYNFRFGNRRLGNAELLSKKSQEWGFIYEKVSQVTLDNTSVSSSLIRDLIYNGRVKAASRYLGSNFTIIGKVERGDGRGKEIGHPTANIHIDEDQITPLNGVYLIYVIIKGSSHYGVANICVRPNSRGLKLEAHLFDFDEDIYGEDIRVEFLSLIRPERKFPTVNDLQYQMRQDIKLAKYNIKNL